MRRALVAGVLVAAIVVATPGLAAAAKTRAKVRRPGPLRVLLVGDSNTVGYQNAAANALAARGYQVVKAGVPLTGLMDTNYCKGRWAKPAAGFYDPDVVVFEYVGNYGYQPKCFEKVAWESATWYKQWAKQAAKMKKPFTKRKARILWVAMPPILVSPWSRTVPRLNAIHRTLGTPVVETWTSTTYSKAGEPHLTPSGYQALAERVVAAIG
jgi:hypothetical protein